MRICGMLGREILDNGSVNWDQDFRRMCDALPTYLASGAPLPSGDLEEVVVLVGRVRTGDAEQAQLARLTELTVAWVLLNRQPLELAAPAYAR